MPLGRIYTPDPVSNHPLNDGLVVWLAGLPEISGGNTLYDIARHARGQLLGSPSWNGDDNTLAGINLSGYTTSQYGIIPYTATPSLSVAAWAYFNAFTASGQTGAATVVDNWGNAPGAFLLLAGPPSPGQLQTAVNTGSQSPWITDPYVMSTGQWYHVGLTIQDGGQLKLFRDGAKVASYTLPNTITLGRPNLGYGVKLNDSGTAYSPDGYPFFLDGKLRDLRVHNRALSESEYFAQYDQALRNHPDTLNRLSSRSRVLFLGGSGTNSAAGAGTVSIAGTSTSSVKDQMIGAGTVSITGASTSSAVDTAAGAGTVSIIGVGTASVVGTVSGAGIVSIAGTGTTSVLDQATGAGIVTISGTGTITTGSNSNAIAAGTVPITGASSASAIDTVAGAGTVAITGTSIAAIKDTAAGAGTVSIAGSGTMSLLAQMAGAGVVPIVGSGSITTGNNSNASANGTVPISGSTTATVIDTITVSGVVSILGSSSGSILIQAAGSGVVPISGSGFIHNGPTGSDTNVYVFYLGV